MKKLEFLEPTTLYIVGVNDWGHEDDKDIPQFFITDDYASLEFKLSSGHSLHIETDGSFYIATKEQLLVIKENLQNSDDYDLEDDEERVFVLPRFKGEISVNFEDENGVDILDDLPKGKYINEAVTMTEEQEEEGGFDVCLRATPGNSLKKRTLAEVLETLVP